MRDPDTDVDVSDLPQIPVDGWDDEGEHGDSDRSWHVFVAHAGRGRWLACAWEVGHPEVVVCTTERAARRLCRRWAESYRGCPRR